MQMIADLLDMIETGRRGPALASPSGLWGINDDGMKVLFVILSACSTVEKRRKPQLETLKEEEELKEEEAGGGHRRQCRGGGRQWRRQEY